MNVPRQRVRLGAKGVTSRGWRDACGGKGGDFSRQRDSYWEGGESRHPLAAWSGEGTGAEAFDAGLGGCGGCWRGGPLRGVGAPRGLGVIPKCMLCDGAALPQTGACGGEDRIQRLRVRSSRRTNA